MISSVLLLVAAACVSGFVAGLEPALLLLLLSQLYNRDGSTWAPTPIPRPQHGDQGSSVLQWCAWWHAQGWRLKKPHLLKPDTAKFRSHSQILCGFPQLWVNGVSTASGFLFSVMDYLCKLLLFFKCRGLHQISARPLGYDVVPDLPGEGWETKQDLWWLNVCLELIRKCFVFLWQNLRK